ncbi:L-alanyl-D-glutamate peptidase [Paenibacillus polymyxa M1]|uniref:M15 family metallopeptidase n=1 Tax=Paenibacillus polymyxa TaxID=1406 RepID=UPI00021BBDD2|nr:M15 family metallopeptidase [Paenibacillus polymyxa]CCC85682.1 L-alanyl-D-glutamate peptidase [Paenibacillus polymyxa M1]
MTITLELVKSKSATRLQGLLPVVRTAAECLIERSFALGIPIVITQGLRTIAEQNELYAQGRTKPGPKVTNAKGGTSYHNFGVAIDFSLLLPDGRSVSWDTQRDGNADHKADWMQVVAIAKELGFEWGGDWKTFTDLPHLQIVFGLSTAQYRAGKRPTKAQIDSVLSRINKTGDDEPMTLEEKATLKELQKTVQAQADRIKTLETAAKQPKVPTWAEQACINAKAVGVLDTANDGSYDFYRMVTMLDRAGIFETKGDK